MSVATEVMAVEIADAVKALSASKTTAFDSPAVIKRIEGDIAWVHFDGGMDETPAKLTINAKPGDIVQVHVGEGTAFLTGNATAPPTDDTKAETAFNVANAADKLAILAGTSAERAQQSADVARQAANTAVDAASTALTQASAATASATEAAVKASEAQMSALQASNSATNALTQLSTVEDVIGVLNWISEHGSYVPTEDTEIIEGKFYFIRSGEGTPSNPYTYAVVNSPESNPSEAGYYEIDSIDEAVTTYISTHLALLDDGLYITLDDNGYKLKLTNQGAYIIDPYGDPISEYSDVTRIGSIAGKNVNIDSDSVDIKDGNTVVASFGEETVIGKETGAHVKISGNRTSFKIGSNEVAYIAVDAETQESVFYMTKAIVVQDLYFGHWQWKSRNNDNLALKWVGYEV